MVNGYTPKSDFYSLISNIHPDCINSINISKNNNGITNDQIEVMLKGNSENLYTVCEGVLYFGQNGYLQTIIIDDECSPDLLFNCSQKPLKEILQFEPEKIKSIELTTDPRNCEGKLDGEFVVIESN